MKTGNPCSETFILLELEIIFMKLKKKRGGIFTFFEEMNHELFFLNAYCTRLVLLLGDVFHFRCFALKRLVCECVATRELKLFLPGK